MNLLLLIGQVVHYGAKLGYGDVLPIIPILIPEMLIYCLPMASLTSTVSTIIRGRSLIEPITLASSGISVQQCLLPMVIVGVLLSLLTFVCFEWVQPAAAKYKNSFLSSRGVEMIGSQLEQDQFTLNLPSQTIYICKTKRGRSIVWQHKKKGKIEREIFISEAEVSVDRKRQGVLLDFKKMTVLQYNDNGEFMVSSLHVEEPVFFQPDELKVRRSDRDLSLSELHKKIFMLSEAQKKEASRAKSYYFEKLAFLFSPLILMMVAFPIAYFGEHSSRVLGFMMALAVIFLIYYPLIMTSKKMVRYGHEPAFWLMQSPNILLIVMCILAMRRINYRI